jgi:toxin ParE1/3/4
MAQFSFSKKALEDLVEIWDYTVQRWSEAQAEKYYRFILSTCADLAQNPHFGKSYEGVVPAVFGYKCGSHIIFFRELDSHLIEIVRILHGRMDVRLAL